MGRTGRGSVYQPGVKKGDPPEPGKTWWIYYGWRGKRHRESSNSHRKGDATRLLNQRLGEMGQGRLIGPSEKRVEFEDLAS